MNLNKFIPFFIFCGIAIALYVGLSLNPSKIPSELIDDPMPEFSLNEPGGETLSYSSVDLAAEDEVILVNFYASWCAPCYVEHPFLMELEDRGYKIYGVNYKDKPRNNAKFLEEQGNPYHKIAADNDGRVAINWGVSGFPETFIIKNGVIRYKHAGPIHGAELEDKIIPILESVR